MIAATRGTTKRGSPTRNTWPTLLPPTIGSNGGRWSAAQRSERMSPGDGRRARVPVPLPWIPRRTRLRVCAGHAIAFADGPARFGLLLAGLEDPGHPGASLADQARTEHLLVFSPPDQPLIIASGLIVAPLGMPRRSGAVRSSSPPGAGCSPARAGHCRRGHSPVRRSATARAGRAAG